ncbi:MAG: hypothetical protein WA829_09155 [Candidatus Acidiferrum sp.]
MRGIFAGSVLIATLLATATGVMALATGQVQGPGEGRTLREVLAEEKVPANAETLHNLDAKISSGAELNDAQQFAIAYYLLDSTGELNPPIFVDVYDRGTSRWKSGAIKAGGAKEESADDHCFGSVLAVLGFSDSYALETHINPSAGCEIILSRDLKVKASLYGWIVGRFGDGRIVYHRSQVHFATVHPAEIAIYNPATGKDFNVFPRAPFQEVRQKLTGELREFYKTHQDYCQKANDPCDPEEFDSAVEGKVATDDREHAMAFVISYEVQGYGQDEHKPGGPAEVVYVCRYVNDEAKMEYREMLWSEVKALAGDAPIERLVEPPMLDKIFGGESKVQGPR